MAKFSANWSFPNALKIPLLLGSRECLDDLLFLPKINTKRRWSVITKRSLLTCGRPKCWLNSNALVLVVVRVTKLKSPSGEQPTKVEKHQMSATRLPPLQQHPPPLFPSGGAVVTEEYHQFMRAQRWGGVLTEEYHQFMLAQSSQTQEHNWHNYDGPLNNKIQR